MTLQEQMKKPLRKIDQEDQVPLKKRNWNMQMQAQLRKRLVAEIKLR